MALRGFVLRRSTKAYSAFGSVYEFRSVNGSKWYPIHRLNMMFPKLNPDVSAYVRQLFTRLDQGEEVEVQGEYVQRGLRGKLLITELVLEQFGPRAFDGIKQTPQSRDSARFSPPARPVLTQIEAQLSQLCRAGQERLEEA